MILQWQDENTIIEFQIHSPASSLGHVAHALKG
jgi:hypothetical protein